MILYLDTSALVKMYLAEAGSSEVLSRAETARSLASSELTFVEFHSALARRRRLGDIDERTFQSAVETFALDWESIFVVEATTRVVRDAARIAQDFGLRAYDAMHLASAVTLPGRPGDEVVFACWDRELAQTARAAGLRTLPAS